MTKSQRSNAAKKANATTKARKQFQKKYGWTAQAARLFLENYDEDSICEYCNITRASLAAIQANLNRHGNFRKMARACNY